MADRVRFHAHPVSRVSTDHAVQIVRNYDGRVFSMSAEEARALAYELDRAADQADRKRRATEAAVVHPSAFEMDFHTDHADGNQ